PTNCQLRAGTGALPPLRFAPTNCQPRAGTGALPLPTVNYQIAMCS
ncbi:MAG: hypothetical protein HC786_33240, partial [Richelia sp. CSU_2_1]|nr:hypothetical protein [Richelia sp. CSU_2_1]